MAGADITTHLQSIERFIVMVHGSPRQLSLSEILVMQAHVDAMLDEIVAGWPVDTSSSRDAWTYTTNSVVGDVSFTLDNRVEYVEFVHFAGDPTLLIDGFVPDVIDAHLPAMLADMKAEILATEIRIKANRARGGRGFIDVIQYARKAS